MRFELQELSVDNLVLGLKHVIEQEHIVADQDALTFIAKEAKGGFRDSLTLLEQVISYAHTKEVTLAITREALGGIDIEDITRFRQALIARDVEQTLMVIDHVEERGKKVDDFIEQTIQAIVADMNANQFEITATKSLLEALRNYRFYRQGTLSIKAEILRFIKQEDRMMQLEVKIKQLESGFPLKNVEQRIDIKQVTPIAEVPEEIKLEEPKPVVLEVYHEKAPVSEEVPPEFLKVHGATEETTVEDMKTRNDIYKSILKDTEIAEALKGEPLTLIRDEITKEAIENFDEKQVFQEIEVTDENKPKTENVSESAMQEIIPNQNLMRVLIEAALFPEKSPIKYIKRRWNLIQSIPGNYFTKLLEDTEVRAASENILVISCYLESVKQELEKNDVRFEITKILKQDLKVDLPYIIVTENEWLRTRSLFVEQWKQGVIDEETLKTYQENEVVDPGVVEGQIGFDIEEMESQELETVKQAKDLFGDIVEVI